MCGRAQRGQQHPLEDALRLVNLYAEKESPKYEAAARRWLMPYIDESSPRLGAPLKGSSEVVFAIFTFSGSPKRPAAAP